MGRNDYISYNRNYRSRKRKKHSGPIIGIILVMLIAVAAGFTTYHLTKGRLPLGPSDTEYAGNTQTPKPDTTQAAQISNTPEPTPSPSPTPVKEPEIGDIEYLPGFVDNRTAVTAKAVYAPRIFEQNFLDQIINLAKTTELNAVVIDVRNDYGQITYDMQLPQAQEMGVIKAFTKDMPALLKALHDNGIYVIARVVCFREMIQRGATEGLTQKAHPEWFCTTKKVNEDSSIIHYEDKLYTSKENSGQTAVWMNPYNDDACKYLVSIARQAIADGFDEVCFDYVRCTTYYISTCDFKIPDEEYVPRTESNWGFPSTITERITDFVKYACNTIKPMGGFVSASVFGMTITSATDEECLGQNYKILSQYVDYLCPMIYPYGYVKGYGGIANPNREPDKLVDYVMQKSNEKLASMATDSVTGHVATVRPWMAASSGTDQFDYTPAMIKSQFPGCYNNGIEGWMLWNSANYYDNSIFTKK